MLDTLKAKARKIESLRATEVGAGMAPPVEPPRPVATPVRSMGVLLRPASTDAQPRSQQLWDEAFPNPDDVQGTGVSEGATATALEPATSVPPESTEPETRTAQAEKPAEPEPPAAVAAPPTAAAEATADDDELIMDCDCATSLHIDLWLLYCPFH